MAKGSPVPNVSVQELAEPDVESCHSTSAPYQSRNQRQQWRILSLFPRKSGSNSTPSRGRKLNRFLIMLLVLTGFVFISMLIWISFMVALLHKLSPVQPHNGLSKLVAHWKEPESSLAEPVSWYPNFSNDVQPKPIHSHNDYLRDIPLFRALSVGCTGVEADIWLQEGDLWVGHTARHLRPSRTLRSLYLTALMQILRNQNQGPSNSTGDLVGVFNDKPSETLVLLLDFKSDPNGSFPLVIEQLAPFRDANYLTRWDGSELKMGPLTIVASGYASERLDLIAQPAVNGTIFLDAPLLNLTDPSSPYNKSNSLYASARTSHALGKAPLHGFTKDQKAKAQALTEVAEARGLRSRFWQTPAWPLGLRDKVWRQLEGVHVGMLNVDDIVVAGSWNLDRCVIAGFRLC